MFVQQTPGYIMFMLVTGSENVNLLIFLLFC